MQINSNIQKLLDEMEKDPWYVKLKRWWRLKIWTWTCLTRKYWDKSYSGYIFKRKKNTSNIDHKSIRLYNDIKIKRVKNRDK